MLSNTASCASSARQYSRTSLGRFSRFGFVAYAISWSINRTRSIACEYTSWTVGASSSEWRCERLAAWTAACASCGKSAQPVSTS